jgi:hypothetical protein
MQQIIEYCPILLLKNSTNTICDYHCDRLNNFQLFEYSCKTNNKQIVEYLIKDMFRYVRITENSQRQVLRLGSTEFI